MNMLDKAKEVLTPRELEYFLIMNAHAGTLFIQGPPGGGKSAIFKSIAKKLGMRYIPHDCPSMDEVDVGLFPAKVVRDGMEVVECLPPLWAYEAMTSPEPVMIVFEEMNRNLKLVNSMLNILNERRVGHKVLWGNNVYLAATGNLGEEDDTTVEELDSAQRGRLIIRKHTIEGESGRQEWMASFAAVASEGRAKGQIHPDIQAFLKHQPAATRPPKEKNSEGIQVDTRRWTYLSEAIIKNFGYDSTIDEYGAFLSNVGPSYIGSYTAKLSQYLTENKRVTIEDVIKGRKFKIENRDNAAELAEQLRAMKINGFKPKEFANVIKFVRSIDHDAQVSLISDWMMAHHSAEESMDHENIKVFKKEFRPEIEMIAKDETV